MPDNLELLASMCSIDKEQTIKRIHVRTNETTLSKKCASTCIYIQVTKYMIRTVHALSTPVLSYPKNVYEHPSKTHIIQAAATKTKESPALPSGNRIPDHSPCQPPLTPPPAPPQMSPPLVWASVPGLVTSPPRAPPGTLYL